MLRLRIATGLAAAGGFLAAVYWLPAPRLSIISTVVLCFAAWEFAALCGVVSQRGRSGFALLVALFAALAWWLLGSDDTARAPLMLAWFAMAALLWLLLAGIVLRYPRDAPLLQRPLVRAVLGLSAMAFAATGFTYLSALPLGKFWIVYVVAVVVLADVGAYFVGKAFGRNKLAPAVSPGKSWEGFWGGLVAAQILSAVFYIWILDIFRRMESPPSLVVQPTASAYPLADELGMLHFALFAVLLSSTSVLGDLFESVLKRNAGVKDSSNLLPGHGGVLDRIDGLLPAVPLLALMLLVSAQLVR